MLDEEWIKLLEDRIEQVRSETKTDIDNHNVRITALEAWKNWVLGGAATLGIGIAAFAKTILHHFGISTD
jgi:hypothetical protein